jgi:hypothetical protein
MREIRGKRYIDVRSNEGSGVKRNETWVMWVSQSVLGFSQLRNCRIVSPSVPYTVLFGKN